MKIMLVGSIRNKNYSSDSSVAKIVGTLERGKHKVIHEHITKIAQNDLDKLSKSDDMKFHSDILKNIKNCDIVISECSQQSLSVGYLLSYAADLGKSVVIFYSSSSPKPNLFPSLVSSTKIFLVEYSNEDELEDLASEYVDYAKDQVDVRFNFFISTTIGNYLDWISKVKKIPRSVYLRGLIESDMGNSDEYNS